MLSTDVGLRRYLHYLRTSQDAQRVFEKVGYREAVLATLGAVPRLLRALLHAVRARQRWPWNPPDWYLDVPLAKLRAEYRIEVL